MPGGAKRGWKSLWCERGIFGGGGGGGGRGIGERRQGGFLFPWLRSGVGCSDKSKMTRLNINSGFKCWHTRGRPNFESHESKFSVTPMLNYILGSGNVSLRRLTVCGNRKGAEEDRKSVV